MSASTLSKPPLMSRNSDETLRAGCCSVRTVSVRAVHVSKEESERGEPHWLRWRRPTYLAMEGQAGGNDPFQNLRDGLEEDNDGK